MTCRFTKGYFFFMFDNLFQLDMYICFFRSFDLKVRSIFLFFKIYYLKIKEFETVFKKLQKLQYIGFVGCVEKK